MGYDTKIDEVNAWSTLGWFKDPILSSMLNRSAGSLAELIIHELSHIRISNHSQDFWNLVEEKYPEYQKTKKWLKEYGEQFIRI